MSPPPPPASYATARATRAGRGDQLRKARKLQKNRCRSCADEGRPLPARGLQDVPSEQAEGAVARLPPTTAVGSSRNRRSTSPLRRRSSPDAETGGSPSPSDPVGWKVGSRLNPYLEALGGYDHQPVPAIQQREGSPMLRGEIGTTMQSEWSEARPRWRDAPRLFELSAREGRQSSGWTPAKVDGKIDVLRDDAFDWRGNHHACRPGSPEIQASTNGVASTNQPVTWSAGGYVGATHTFNRQREWHARRTRADRPRMRHSLTARSRSCRATTARRSAANRASHEISPGFKPFIEGSFDRREYDHTYDVNGFMRSSYGYSARAARVSKSSAR